jgi:hypothetical protein
MALKWQHSELGPLIAMNLAYYEQGYPKLPLSSHIPVLPTLPDNISDSSDSDSSDSDSSDSDSSSSSSKSSGSDNDTPVAEASNSQQKTQPQLKHNTEPDARDEHETELKVSIAAPAPSMMIEAADVVVAVPVPRKRLADVGGKPDDKCCKKTPSQDLVSILKRVLNKFKQAGDVSQLSMTRKVLFLLTNVPFFALAVNSSKRKQPLLAAAFSMIATISTGFHSCQCIQGHDHENTLALMRGDIALCVSLGALITLARIRHLSLLSAASLALGVWGLLHPGTSPYYAEAHGLWHGCAALYFHLLTRHK